MGMQPSLRTTNGVPGLPGAHAIMELARVPMAITVGATHVVHSVNAALCSVLGKAREDLIGRPFTETLPDGHDCLLLLDRVYRTGKPESHTEDECSGTHSAYWSYEVWAVLAEGDRPAGVIIQVSETTFFHQQAVAMNEALLMSSVRQHELAETAEMLNAKLQVEMKDRMHAEETLLRTEKLASMGRMAASIAHEINNPLEAVVNTLFLAQSIPDLPESARGYLEIADKELMRIAHITRQTLGFYRESSTPTTNSVSALLDSVIDLLQSKIKRKRARVEKQCHRDLQMTGVFGELRQIVSNLLANSLDAVEENGSVKLRAAASSCYGNGQRCIRITIADDGTGIDTAAMKRVFEPFFTTKDSVGTGLGLWVSKQLVGKHGGSIQIRSRTSGAHRGTTVSVAFPVDAAIPATNT